MTATNPATPPTAITVGDEEVPFIVSEQEFVSGLKGQKRSDGKVVINVSGKEMIIDYDKAVEIYQGKKVINGRQSSDFALSPLRYPWAFKFGKKMLENHWLPDKINMDVDQRQWTDPGALTETERWIITMAIGYFNGAEGFVADNQEGAVHAYMTAPELKFACGCHIQQELIHSLSLMYMTESLGLDPNICTALMSELPSIKAKQNLLSRHSVNLRGHLDMTKLENKQALAKNIFAFTQVLEGTQFFALFAMVLSMRRRKKMNGIGQMFEYTLRDECLTPDTDLLTLRGWVKVPDLQSYDKVAQYNEDGTLEFVAPTRTSKSKPGSLYHFKNEQGHINLKVSPNHRMVMVTKHGRLKITPASECQHNPYSRHIMAGVKKGGTYNSLTPHDRLLIALQADGNIPSGKYRNGNHCGHILVHFKLKKTRKINRLKRILEETGHTFRALPAEKGQTDIVVEMAPKEAIKGFSWVNLEAVTFNWCQEFLQELKHWDGHTVQASKGKTTRERNTWGSVTEKDADMVQAIAALANCRTHHRTWQHKKVTNASPYHRVQINHDRNYIRGGKITKTEEPYDGFVYGVQVPSGMLLVRREGAVAVTGNSLHIGLGRAIFLALVSENPDIMTTEFGESLFQLMKDGVTLEHAFIDDCIARASVGLNAPDYKKYVTYIGNRRLASLNLKQLDEQPECPFPWLLEIMDLDKEKNFFETKVTAYASSSKLGSTDPSTLLAASRKPSMFDKLKK